MIDRELKEMDFPCEKCGAEKGEVCRAPSGREAAFHNARHKALSAAKRAKNAHPTPAEAEKNFTALKNELSALKKARDGAEADRDWWVAAKVSEAISAVYGDLVLAQAAL